MTIRKILLAGACVALLAACDTGGGDKQDETGAGTDAGASPELGSWGVELAHIDDSVDPGDDFFRHVSGKWLDSYELKPDETRYGSFLVLRDRSEERVRAIIDSLGEVEAAEGSAEQMVGDYFASFMDIEARNAKGVEAIRPELDRIAAIADRADLIEAFGRSGIDNTIAPIDGGISIDRKNPDRYMLSIGHSGLGLPDKSYYLDDSERFAKIREAYVTHIAQMLQFTGVSEADAAAQADAIMALETGIAEHHWERAELRNRDKTYNVFTIAELESEFPGYPWRRHLEAGGIDPADVEKLNISTPDAIAPIAGIVSETPLETFKAYLTYHAVSNHAGFLSEDIDNANFEFFGKVLRGQQEQRDLWKRGVGVVGGRQGLGEALGKIYVDRHFPSEAKAQMEDLVENLRAALRQRIEGLEWMGEETKEEAFAKLAAFNPKIGYPDSWESYEGVEITPDDLMANVRAVRAFFHQDQIARLNQPTDKTEWFMTPQTVNAYYNPSFNEIVFPAAILQPPFFDPAADPAVNYGAIGAVIGHEMGHGFDDQGSKSDAAGVQRNWWTDEDRARFEERTQQLVAQYNEFEPMPGEHINGQLTLGENIGDLGGLSMAYTAYKLSLDGKEAPVIDGYTGDQRFFMAWAQVWRSKRREEALLQQLKSDPHSPSEARVNGVVRNIDAWYEAFDVTEADALYLPPEERVSIW